MDKSVTLKLFCPSSRNPFSFFRHANSQSVENPLQKWRQFRQYSFQQIKQSLLQCKREFLKQSACSNLVASPLMARPCSLSRFRVFVVAEGVSSTADVAARRVYVGNIPRTVNNDELMMILEEHGAVKKVEPLVGTVSTLLQQEETKFVDGPYKVYMGNLSKTVTSESLIQFFSEKVKVIGAKISTVPGTSKPSGFGFVTFSSAEDVEAAITA